MDPEELLMSCRFCLMSSESNVNIFSPELLAELLPQKILCVLSVLVHPYDTLPQVICKDCLENIKVCYKFLGKASSSNSFLLSFLRKNEDSAKIIYANMISTFQQKNYFCLNSNQNRETFIKEKYIEVYNKASELINDFSGSNVSNDLGEYSVQVTMKNGLKTPGSYQLVLEPSSLNTNIRLTSQPIQMTSSVTEKKSPRKKPGPKSRSLKRSVVSNIPSRLNSKSSEVDTHSPYVTKTEPHDSLQNNHTNTEVVFPKIPKLTAYACKFCKVMRFNSKEKAIRHECECHDLSVSLNRYYGSDHLALRIDYLEQVKRLSYPKQRKCKRTPSTFKATNVPKVSIAPLKKSPVKRKIAPSFSDSRVKKKPFNQGNPPDSLEKSPIKRKCIKELNIEPIVTRALNVSSAGGSDFFCRFCSSPLASSQEYLSHLNKYQCNVSRFHCKFCRMDFSNNPLSLDNHMHQCFSMMAFPNDSRCFKCNLFIDVKKLELHLTSEQEHEETTYYKCFICYSIFNQKNDLINHLETRCKFNPIIHETYNCYICRSEFIDLKEYHLHQIREHTGLYLNLDLSLDYSVMDQFKPTDILAPYKIENFEKCNSKGNYLCGIKQCKKVLNTIFELEEHVNSHVMKVSRMRKERKGAKNMKKKMLKLKIPNVISLTDDFLSKNRSMCEPNSFSTLSEQEQFVLNFDLERIKLYPSFVEETISHLNLLNDSYSESETNSVNNDRTELHADERPPSSLKGVFEPSDFWKNNIPSTSKPIKQECDKVATSTMFDQNNAFHEVIVLSDDD